MSYPVKPKDVRKFMEDVGKKKRRSRSVKKRAPDDVIYRFYKKYHSNKNKKAREWWDKLSEKEKKERIRKLLAKAREAKKNRPLTIKERTFIRELLRTGSKSTAAALAYKERCKPFIVPECHHAGAKCQDDCDDSLGD